MQSLLILLPLFCPLIFSAAISIGSLSDYNGETRDQHPTECYEKAENAAENYEDWRDGSFTDDQLRVVHEVLQKCMSDMALINPKVKKVEKQLTQKMFDMIKFFRNEVMKCGFKLQGPHRDDECHRSTLLKRGDYFCNNLWGKDGCMIKKYDDICGEGMANKLRDMALFQSSKQKECIDKYFK